LCEKISLSNIFALWAFHKNLTRGENMEEYEETGASVAATFIMKSGRQLLEQLHHDGSRACQFRPKQSTILPVWPMFPTRCGAYGFFHFSISCSNCLVWYWGWQWTSCQSWIRKTVTVFLLLKKFVRVIFTVTDNHENLLTAKI